MLAFAASRAAMLDFHWSVDSSKICGAIAVRSTSRLNPLDLRVPAVDLGLELAQDRLGLEEASLGRLDISLGHLDELAGQVDSFLVELDGRVFCAEVLDDLRHEKRGKYLALLDSVANIDNPLLDVGGQLGIDRRTS